MGKSSKIWKLNPLFSPLRPLLEFLLLKGDPLSHHINVNLKKLLKIPNIKHAKAIGISNPITGQHLELIVEVENNKEEIDLV